MRCFLIGSKELSVRVLEELVRQGHEVRGVLTRDHEDGMKVWLDTLGHRSLRIRSGELGIPAYEKISINSDEMIHVLTRMNLDILFSVFWGEIVKETVLNIPKLGCFNLHTAYLPANRGSFPNSWAIINGENHAGLTIHKMLPGVDNGPIASQVAVPIEEGETGESLYNKVTEAGFHLFKETLPQFASMSYTLTPQDLNKGSYHPRGYPFGGQIDPYWSHEKKTRFKNASYFLPFKNHVYEPPRFLSNHTSPNVRIMLGFDCDRPRGSFVVSAQGAEMAERKLHSIERISGELENLGIPRTLFLCGQFLESMAHKYGPDRLKRVFCINSSLVELADHSYSHNILKRIKTRPDKSPMSSQQVIGEYRHNTDLFKEILAMYVPSRGYRTPLGHYKGLSGEYVLLDKLLSEGIKYISSDLRDDNQSLNPPLVGQDGKPRQPYRYENGLLEIPAMGWQDTVFSGTSKTPVFEDVPKSYDQIIAYYQQLFSQAQQIAVKNNRDYFLGLVLHPYDNSLYNVNGRFFYDLSLAVSELGASFCTYNDVSNHYSVDCED